eukprot:14835555-Alexandrium_andersonii.AAC.1
MLPANTSHDHWPTVTTIPRAARSIAPETSLHSRSRPSQDRSAGAVCCAVRRKAPRPPSGLDR